MILREKNAYAAAKVCADKAREDGIKTFARAFGSEKIATQVFDDLVDGYIEKHRRDYSV